MGNKASKEATVIPAFTDTVISRNQEYLTEFRVVSKGGERETVLRHIDYPQSVILHYGKRSSASEMLNDLDYFLYNIFRCLEVYTWPQDIYSSQSQVDRLLFGPSTQERSPRKPSPRIIKVRSHEDHGQELSLVKVAPMTDRSLQLVHERLFKRDYTDDSMYNSLKREYIIQRAKGIVRAMLLTGDMVRATEEIRDFIEESKSPLSPELLISLNFRPSTRIEMEDDPLSNTPILLLYNLGMLYPNLYSMFFLLQRRVPTRFPSRDLMLLCTLLPDVLIAILPDELGKPLIVLEILYYNRTLPSDFPLLTLLPSRKKVSPEVRARVDLLLKADAGRTPCLRDLENWFL